MKVVSASLSDVLIIEPDCFADSRGFFFETWRSQRYEQLGLPKHFVQDNISFSLRGVLRGLHFQNPKPQGKLVSVLTGEVFDVVVDLRRGSPTFGRWEGITLSGENKKQLYVPPGFAHGFVVTSESAFFLYKCTQEYDPSTEVTLVWNDPDINIRWPLPQPTISEKDAMGLRLSQINVDRLFKHN